MNVRKIVHCRMKTQSTCFELQIKVGSSLFEMKAEDNIKCMNVITTQLVCFFLYQKKNYTAIPPGNSTLLSTTQVHSA